MTDFLSFFFPKAKVIEEPIDPREEEKPKRKKLNKNFINEVKHEEE
tara:strand:- start:207 stop:344 length:138 start_codon:yes stop_codon:yes gene_type:complete